MSTATHTGTGPPYRPPAIVRWVGLLSEASGWLAAVALVLATLITSHGVFVRYFLRQPTVWQTESTIYLLMLVTFVGLVPRRPQLAVAVVLVVMWTSYQDWYEAYLYDHHSSTAFRFPLWIAFAILPLGMLLVALQYVAMIVEGIMGLAGRVPMSQVSLMTGTSELAQVSSELELEQELHPEDGVPGTEGGGRA